MDFFGKDYDYPEIYFNVGGYKVEKGISVPHVYVVSIAQKVVDRKNYDGESLIYGASWNGQKGVLTRLTMNFQQVEKTVGGPIYILVLRPNETPLWINKKELH